MEEERLYLTVNDYIDLSDGLRLPYHTVPDTRDAIVGEGNRGNDEVNEIFEEAETETEIKQVQIIYENEITRRVSLKSLPPGKKYHVFFSHSREDREWVLRMVNKLESPQYGFKCCFADRDFDLGCPVFENITKFVNLSKKTVVVLSPEFLESPWCSYETRITMEMDLDTRQRLLVPVMLRSCTVPSFIGRLSYIDVENEHFWHRFLQTLMGDGNDLQFSETVGSAAIMNSSPFQFNPNFFSSEIISEVNVYVGCNCSSDSSADFMPDELMRNGLQLTEEEYRAIMKIISETCFVRCHGCYNKPCYWSTFSIIHSACFIFFVFCALAGGVGFGSMVWIVIATITGITRYRVILAAIQWLSEAIIQANKIAINRNMMISLKDYGCCYCACDRISIIFMYYDWRPCQAYLKRLLFGMRHSSSNEHQIRIEENEHQMPSLTDSHLNVSQEDLEGLEHILLKHATEYGQLLHSRRTMNPNEKRHTRQGECLCQFIESIMMSGKSSCLDRVYGATQRHPWRRLIEF